MAELKRVMDAFTPLDTAAYQRVLAQRPGFREFGDAKWAALSTAMWVTMSAAKFAMTVQSAVSLVVPVLAARMKNVAPIVLAATVFAVGGVLGLLFAPAAAPWLWVILCGLGTLIFPLSLVLINLRTRSATGSVTLSGFVQGIGYVVSASGPLAVGFLHAATGAWVAPLWFLIAVVALALPAAVILARPRFVEDEVGV